MEDVSEGARPRAGVLTAHIRVLIVSKGSIANKVRQRSSTVSALLLQRRQRCAKDHNSRPTANFVIPLHTPAAAPFHRTLVSLVSAIGCGGRADETEADCSGGGGGAVEVLATGSVEAIAGGLDMHS